MKTAEARACFPKWRILKLLARCGLALAVGLPVATQAQLPVITAQPQGRVVSPGTSVTLAVKARSATPLRYQWRLNGQNMPRETNSTLVFASAQPTSGGTYHVIVVNAAGAVQSQPAVLLVSAPPLPFADSFANRGTIVGRAGQGSGSNTFASHEVGEPEHAGREGEHSVWLRWVAPANGVVTFHTLGSSFDTLLAIYTNRLGSTGVGNLTNIVANDDLGGVTSSVLFRAFNGVEYSIAVAGRREAAGNIVLNWNLTPGLTDVPRITQQPQSVVSNFMAQLPYFLFGVDGATTIDWFQNGVGTGEKGAGIFRPAFRTNVNRYTAHATAGDLVVESEPAVLEISNLPVSPTADKLADALDGFEYVPGLAVSRRPKIVSPVAGTVGYQLLNNFGASTENGEPNHGGVLGGASRWQVFVPPIDGTLVLDTAGSDPDTVLAVYTGENLASLRLIVQDDNSGPEPRSAMVSFSVTAGTRYLVAIDTVGGVTGIIQLNWRLGRFPTLSQPSAYVFNPGQPVFLSVDVAGGAGPFTYQWLKNGQPLPGQTNPSLFLFNPQIADEGIYALIVNTILGPVTNTTRLARYGPVPVITNDPKGRVLAQGGDLVLASSATASLPVSYQWQFKRKSIKGATNSSLTISSATVQNSGEYRVIVSTTGGSATSAVAAVSVLIPPAVTASPKPVLVGNARKAAFIIRATGSGPLTYQWQFNGVDIPFANASTHLITNAQPTQLGGYRCVVSNAVGFAASAEAQLTGVAIKTQPRDATVPAGKKATFTVKAIGPAPLHYQWWHNGVGISNATNASYVIPAAVAMSAGTYAVQVSSPLGATLSGNATLNVTAPPLRASHPANYSLTPSSVRMTVELPGDGTVRIIVRGAAGAACRLETSADLLHWRPVGELKLAEDGQGEFRDFYREPQSFYRAVLK